MALQWFNKCVEVLKTAASELKEGVVPAPKFPDNGNVTEAMVVQFLKNLPALSKERLEVLLIYMPNLQTCFDESAAKKFIEEGKIWAALASTTPRHHVASLTLLAEYLVLTTDDVDERWATVAHYVMWQRFIVAAHSHVWLQGCPAWEALCGVDRMLYHVMPQEPVDEREAAINSLLGVRVY